MVSGDEYKAWMWFGILFPPSLGLDSGLYFQSSVIYRSSFGTSSCLRGDAVLIDELSPQPLQHELTKRLMTFKSITVANIS